MQINPKIAKAPFEQRKFSVESLKSREAIPSPKQSDDDSVGSNQRTNFNADKYTS